MVQSAELDVWRHSRRRWRCGLERRFDLRRVPIWLGWRRADTLPELQLYKHGINSFSAVDTPAGYSTGTWYHYIATYDAASNATIYINGSQAATAVLAYVADNWSPLTIGNGKWNGLVGQRGVSGIIDEVAVYTNLLTPTRISAHYSAGISQSPPIPYKQVVLNDNPMLYYRMDAPAYINPNSTPSPPAINYGSAPVDGAYLSGTVPARSFRAVALGARPKSSRFTHQRHFLVR